MSPFWNRFVHPFATDLLFTRRFEGFDPQPFECFLVDVGRGATISILAVKWGNQIPTTKPQQAKMESVSQQ